MRIRAKLNLVFFLLVAGFVLALGVLLYFNTITTSLRQLQLESQQVARNLFNLTDRTKALITTTGELRQAIDDWNSARRSFEAALATFQKDAGSQYLSPDLRSRINSAVTDWQPTASQLTGTEEGIRAVAASPAVEESEKKGLDAIIIKLTGEGKTKGQLFFTLLTTRTKLQNADFAARTFMTKDLSSVESELAGRVAELTRTSRLISVILSAVLIVAATIFILRFNQGFGRRISRIEAVLGSVSDRDLTVQAEDSGNDELGAVALHVNSMLEILREFFRGVQLAARQVLLLKDTLSAGTSQSVAAVHEISRNIEAIQTQLLNLSNHISGSAGAVGDILEGTSSLSDDISEQSSAIEESAASIEQMNASIESISRLSDERQRQLADLLGVIADGGGKVSETNEMVAAISKEVDGMLDIIEIINAVAEQTNLLSMNASIESAHAGDAGRGFAVVAEEIRKLAESTSENAATIGISLRSVTAQIREALNLSESSRLSFHNISTEVESFADALSSVANAMTELSGGSREIVQATGRISEVTHRVRSNSRDMANRSNEIAEAMHGSQDISSSVVRGITEIDAAAKEILNTLLDINRTAEENRVKMDDLGSTVETFTVPAAPGDEQIPELQAED